MTARRSWNFAVLVVLTASALGCASYYGEERQGLGTSWGETRDSVVRSVRFEREEPEGPVDVATLYYDDAAGVQAMLPHPGGWASVATDGVTAAGALRVRLVDAQGIPLPHVRDGRRNYVVGREGARYAIEVHNGSGRRFEVVATVDGLDVFDGRAGSFAKRGYLIDPWGTLRIDGFRQNMAEVAAFRFGAVGESYAAQTGSAANVGVVAVAFFGERGGVPPGREGEAARRLGADPFPGRFAAPPPGVGWRR